MEAPQVLGTQDAQHIFVEYHRYLPFPFSFIPYESHALVLPPGGSMVPSLDISLKPKPPRHGGWMGT